MGTTFISFFNREITVCIHVSMCAPVISESNGEDISFAAGAAHIGGYHNRGLGIMWGWGPWLKVKDTSEKAVSTLKSTIATKYHNSLNFRNIGS